MLQRREEEILRTIGKLEQEFVLIGGYAVNAYTLPRFSTDCDLVVREAAQLRKTLRSLGYTPKEESSHFIRFEKEIGQGMTVSVDLLVGSVIDRQTGARFEAEWLFEHSAVRQVHGKTAPEAVTLRVADVDALIVMKWTSLRATDVRDVFMLAPQARDREWIRHEVAARTGLEERARSLVKSVQSRQFRDNLHGVFGRIDGKQFERHLGAVRALAEG